LPKPKGANFLQKYKNRVCDGSGDPRNDPDENRDKSTLHRLLAPRASAESAGLHYVGDEERGFARASVRGHVQFLTSDGEILQDEQHLSRIRALVIPPAWKDVWICPKENGHLQATGRDERGRKQYLYHSRWREVRESVKYGHLLEFLEALPQIRRRVAKDMKHRGFDKKKVLATVVRLLELTLIRVGNEHYARENHSFGLSTLRNRHVHVSGVSVRFQFRGKSGKRHSIRITDQRIARTLSRLQDLPGQKLFQFEDVSGVWHAVESGDVNDYLREITGRDFTAKDFRTWAGTMLAMMALQTAPPFTSEAQAKRNITRAVEHAAAQLGNTPAICRKCYVHPEVFACYLNGSMPLFHEIRKPRKSVFLREFSPEERFVRNFLRRQDTLRVHGTRTAVQRYRLFEKRRNGSAVP